MEKKKEKVYLHHSCKKLRCEGKDNKRVKEHDFMFIFKAEHLKHVYMLEDG